MHCGLFSGRAVEAFPEQVGVAVVARVLLDHVREHPAQREAAAPPEPRAPTRGYPTGSVSPVSSRVLRSDRIRGQPSLMPGSTALRSPAARWRSGKKYAAVRLHE